MTRHRLPQNLRYFLQYSLLCFVRCVLFIYKYKQPYASPKIKRFVLNISSQIFEKDTCFSVWLLQVLIGITYCQLQWTYLKNWNLIFVLLPISLWQISFWQTLGQQTQYLSRKHVSLFYFQVVKTFCTHSKHLLQSSGALWPYQWKQKRHSWI